MPAIAKTQWDVENDTAIVTTTPCCVCGKTHTFVLDAIKYGEWIGGAHIQNVFPEMSIIDREILISGTCGPCFDQLFPPEDE